MRRIVPVFVVLALAAACHSAPDELPAPDAGAVVARPPASAPSASASASSSVSAAPGEDAGNPILSAFCEGAFAADVDRQRQKCSEKDMAVAASMARSASRLCANNLSLAIARSRATFDDAKAQACVAMLKEKQLAQSSETDTLFQHPPCDRLLVGLQPEGQACRFSIECKEGLSCVGYQVGIDGVCKKPPAVGQACTPQLYGTVYNDAAAQPHHPPCAAGAYCDGKTCQAKVAAGKGCSKSDACSGGLSCVEGKCGARAPVGASCAGPADCTFGLWCDRTAAGGGGTGTCAARHLEGEACTAPEQCKGRCEVPRGRDNKPTGPGKCVATCGSG